MVIGGAGSGDDAGRDPGRADADDFDDPGDFDVGDFADPGDFADADDFAGALRDAGDDAVDDAGRAGRPERDESDDGLLPVGSFSVNDLNMGCPIMTR